MREITLYVPIADNSGAPRPEVAEFIESEFARIAGGATSVNAVGSWHGSRFFRENVRLVSALLGDGADITFARELAQHVKRELAQESVLLTVYDRIRAEFV